MRLRAASHTRPANTSYENDRPDLQPPSGPNPPGARATAHRNNTATPPHPPPTTTVHKTRQRALPVSALPPSVSPCRKRFVRHPPPSTPEPVPPKRSAPSPTPA